VLSGRTSGATRGATTNWLATEGFKTVRQIVKSFPKSKTKAQKGKKEKSNSKHCDNTTCVQMRANIKRCYNISTISATI
jgi:serine/threonine protein phosphatase PrpC